RYAASHTAIASFASSDGWKDAGPKLTQRRAPLIGGAITRTTAQAASVASTSVGASGRSPSYLQPEATSIPAGPRTAYVARPLRLEVRHGVRAAHDRRGRRRAVDHHDPEGRQRERHEHEDVPLRSSPHSWQVRHEAPELLAAPLEVRELVVARARRREQDDVS